MAFLRISVAVGLFLVGPGAFASERLASLAAPTALSSSPSYSFNQTRKAQTERVRLAHTRWRFLGCTASPHQCSHMAHNSGFYNHRAVDDHHGRCHHPPYIYACWAAD